MILKRSKSPNELKEITDDASNHILEMHFAKKKYIYIYFLDIYFFFAKYISNIYTFVTHYRCNQCFTFLAWLNLKTRIHMLTHTPTPIYTHLLTTTHKQNLNGFVSGCCRIFDFCLYFVAFLIFDFIPSF